jgi:hypothetical protein
MIILQRDSKDYFIKSVRIEVSEEASVSELAEACRLFMIALGYDVNQCLEAIPDPDAEDYRDSLDYLDFIDSLADNELTKFEPGVNK